MKKLSLKNLLPAFMVLIFSSANAMHIMEGYLPVKYSLLWIVVSLPFVLYGMKSIKSRLNENPRNITLIAMAGAFIFVISSLKIPSVTGSCSHMTGTGLGAILFGPSIVAVLGLIVLLFQALLLAHGGITTIGANTFSMSIAGPIITFIIYKLCLRMKVNKRIAIFLGAMLGDLATYCVTSLQLAMAFPSENGGVLVSAVKFLGVFAPTQLPLSIIEGILTVIIIIGLEKYARKELRNIKF
ncbi:energy-coupling factor ABC transporter permease [Fusobacterium sp.]|uniref:energy-coupling factor ABC transporter permease n=1 Tax=Fusobacterium sp. TaxID=68766 RepID=UPI00262D14C7|nr:energy-coupling factor ABC transporter permease [Fusobacterium sp.]